MFGGHVASGFTTTFRYDTWEFDGTSWQQTAGGPGGRSRHAMVYDSQRAYAAKVVPARRAVYAPYNLGANYYWPEKK